MRSHRLKSLFTFHENKWEKIILIPKKCDEIKQDEWRIKMPVIEALFFKTQPVADIRVTTKSNGQDYPPHVPSHIPKLCETHIVRT